MTTLFGIFLAVSAIGNIVMGVTLRQFIQREYVAKMGYKRRWNGYSGWAYSKDKWEGDLDHAYKRAKRESEIALYGLQDSKPVENVLQPGQWRREA